MRTVLLFIPHYTYTSDLLRTRYITALAEQYCVVALSPVFEDAAASDYPRHPNLVYRGWRILRPRLRNFWTKNIRVPFIREFNHLAYYHQRGYAFRSTRRKIMRVIGRLLPAALVRADFITRVEGWCTPPSREFRTLRDEYKPSLIITCTPGFSDLEAEIILLARKEKIPTVAINFSWDNLTTNAQQIRKTDYLICWNHVIRREAETIHRYPPERLFVSGIMRFDHHFSEEEHLIPPFVKEVASPRAGGFIPPFVKEVASPRAGGFRISREDFLRSKGLDPEKKTLFFTTVPQHTYPCQPDFLRLIRRLMENGSLPAMNIFTRFHPGDIREKYAEFEGVPGFYFEYGGQIVAGKTGKHKVEMTEADHANLRHSLAFCDINVNFCSSITLEAVIYDKPVINLAFGGWRYIYDRDHYAPIIKYGAVRMAENDGELIDAIRTYLENPARNREGRKKVFDDYVVFRDGKAYQRNVDFLEKIISG